MLMISSLDIGMPELLLIGVGVACFGGALAFAFWLGTRLKK
jgi:hypothetical protein